MTLRVSLEDTATYTEEGLLDPRTSIVKDLSFVVPCVRTLIVNATYESNLPLIASHTLGNPDLWWCLLMYNGLVDPILDIKLGTVLRIPDKTSLMTILNLNVDDTTTYSITL